MRRDASSSNLILLPATAARRATASRPLSQVGRGVTRLLGATLLSVALVGCGQSEPGTIASAATSGEQPGFDVAGLIQVMIAPPAPDAAAAFLAGLPEPSARDTLQVMNRHRPSQLDQVVTLHYPGVEVELYQRSEPFTRLPSSVTVTRTDVEHAGLRVGMGAADARAALRGAEELAAGPDATYLVTSADAAPHQVTLEVAAGQLRAFTVTAYLD